MNWRPWRNFEADVSSVGPSLERILSEQQQNTLLPTVKIMKQGFYRIACKVSEIVNIAWGISPDISRCNWDLVGLEMYLEKLNGEQAKMFYGLFMAYS